MKTVINHHMQLTSDEGFSREVDNIIARDYLNVLHADAFRFDDEYVLEVAVPGMSRDDIKLSVEGDQLVVEAERKSKRKFSDETQLHARHFRRGFMLPRDVDANGIKASCVNGLLTISLKRNVTAGRQILIDAGSNKQSAAHIKIWKKLKNLF